MGLTSGGDMPVMQRNELDLVRTWQGVCVCVGVTEGQSWKSRKVASSRDASSVS